MSLSEKKKEKEKKNINCPLLETGTIVAGTYEGKILSPLPSQHIRLFFFSYFCFLTAHPTCFFLLTYPGPRGLEKADSIRIKAVRGYEVNPKMCFGTKGREGKPCAARGDGLDRYSAGIR